MSVGEAPRHEGTKARRHQGNRQRAIANSDQHWRHNLVVIIENDEPDWEEHVTRAPEVLGIQELGDDAVNIRVTVWVAAGERRRFERYLRLKLKEALDQAEIEMPNRQLDVWLRGQPQAA